MDAAMKAWRHMERVDGSRAVRRVAEKAGISVKRGRIERAEPARNQGLSKGRFYFSHHPDVYT